MSYIQEMKEKIASLEHEVRQVQDACSHPLLARSVVHRRGGEFDNEFFTDNRCGLCDKFWIEEIK